jgi:hypothetical protein
VSHPGQRGLLPGQPVLLLLVDGLKLGEDSSGGQEDDKHHEPAEGGTAGVDGCWGGGGHLLSEGWGICACYAHAATCWCLPACSVQHQAAAICSDLVLHATENRPAAGNRAANNVSTTPAELAPAPHLLSPSLSNLTGLLTDRFS